MKILDKISLHTILAYLINRINERRSGDTVEISNLAREYYNQLSQCLLEAKTSIGGWEVKEGKCSDCGTKARVYRLVAAKGYDKTRDKRPKYRCETCSIKKAEELRGKGVTF
jgi:hypothetical protein